MAQHDRVMTDMLSDRLGLGPHELVSIIGAGGKTTLLHALGRQLASSGNRVVLTTTTKMASDQVTDPAIHDTDPARVDASFVEGTPLFVVAGHTGGKANGLAPGEVDRLFAETSADYVIAEADGARTMSIKAPADHEPVIASATTTVVIVMAADALGSPLRTVAHRPERVAEIADIALDDDLTPRAAASVVSSPNGGLKGVPDQARSVVVITKVSQADSDAVDEFVGLVSACDLIDSVVTID